MIKKFVRQFATSSGEKKMSVHDYGKLSKEELDKSSLRIAEALETIKKEVRYMVELSEEHNIELLTVIAFDCPDCNVNEVKILPANNMQSKLRNAFLLTEAARQTIFEEARERQNAQDMLV